MIGAALPGPSGGVICAAPRSGGARTDGVAEPAPDTGAQPSYAQHARDAEARRRTGDATRRADAAPREPEDSAAAAATHCHRHAHGGTRIAEPTASAAATADDTSTITPRPTAWRVREPGCELPAPDTTPARSEADAAPLLSDQMLALLAGSLSVTATAAAAPATTAAPSVARAGAAAPPPRLSVIAAALPTPDAATAPSAISVIASAATSPPSALPGLPLTAVPLAAGTSSATVATAASTATAPFAAPEVAGPATPLPALPGLPLTALPLAAGTSSAVASPITPRVDGSAVLVASVQAPALALAQQSAATAPAGLSALLADMTPVTAADAPTVAAPVDALALAAARREPEPALDAASGSGDATPPALLGTTAVSGTLRTLTPQGVTATPLAMPAHPDAGFDDGLGTRIVWMAEQKLGHAQIRLNPEHAGPIDVRIHLDGTRVAAEFQSANADVRQALEASLPRLRDLLGQQGLQLGHTDIGQRQGQGQGASGHGFAGPMPGAAATGSGGDVAPLPVTVAALRSRGLLDEYA